MGIDPFRAVAGQRRLGYDGTLKAYERQRCIASNVRLTSRCELADTEPYLQHFPGEMPLGFCLDCLDRSDLRLN